MRQASGDNLVELPPQARAKFEALLEECRRAWEGKDRNPGAIVDAMWWADNYQQPYPAWLKEAAAKFPSDQLAGPDTPTQTQLVRHSLKGPHPGTPQDHYGQSEFCQYAIQNCFPSVTAAISRKDLYADVREFLGADSDFLASGLPLPSDDTIERALDKVLLKRP
jgi:hypothetical protein